MPFFHYMAYGLHIASILPCPELLPTEPGASLPDIYVRYAKLPASLVNARAIGNVVQAKPGQALFRHAGIATFMVSKGRDIFIDPAPNSTAETIRLFLLGSMLGTLLHQRSVLPLHGSAIETPNGAVIFAGASGQGKSTLAAAFHRLGYRILADDVSAIACHDAGYPLVYPGYPQLKISATAADALHQATAGLRPIDPAAGKYALPIRDAFCTQPLPLYAIYMLRTTATRAVELQRLGGVERLRVLATQTFRKRLLAALGVIDSHFQQLSAVTQSAVVSWLARAHDFYQLDEVIDLLERDFT
jgi:hypothetical protein